VHGVAHIPVHPFRPIPYNRHKIIHLVRLTPLVPGVQFIRCARQCRARIGVSSDDSIWDGNFTHRTRDGRPRRSQKARLAAVADRSVSHLLRLDDDADCGAGTDHRVAARPYSRPVPRQQRTVRRQDKGCAGNGSIQLRKNSASSDPAAINSAIKAVPVNPGSFNPVPVNPGSNSSGPVFPGRTATSCAEPVGQQAGIQDAVETSPRTGGRRPGSDHHIRSQIRETEDRRNVRSKDCNTLVLCFSKK
jgi:hypothetical protein